jgi:hypothetical protein
LDDADVFRADRTAMIDQGSELNVSRQCEILDLNRTRRVLPAAFGGRRGFYSGAPMISLNAVPELPKAAQQHLHFIRFD